MVGGLGPGTPGPHHKSGPDYHNAWYTLPVTETGKGIENVVPPGEYDRIVG